VPYTRRGQRTQYSDWLRAGRSADRILVGAIFRSTPEWPWGSRSLLYHWYRVIAGGRAAGGWR
jgi:hypothetical protein